MPTAYQTPPFRPDTLGVCHGGFLKTMGAKLTLETLEAEAEAVESSESCEVDMSKLESWANRQRLPRVHVLAVKYWHRTFSLLNLLNSPEKKSRSAKSPKLQNSAQLADDISQTYTLPSTSNLEKHKHLDIQSTLYTVSGYLMAWSPSKKGGLRSMPPGCSLTLHVTGRKGFDFDFSPAIRMSPKRSPWTHVVPIKMGTLPSTTSFVYPCFLVLSESRSSL